MVFKRVRQGPKSKPDKPGTVVIRIFRQDDNKVDFFPTAGNRREDIVLDGATVGDVFAAIEEALGLGDSEDHENLGEES